METACGLGVMYEQEAHGPVGERAGFCRRFSSTRREGRWTWMWEDQKGGMLEARAAALVKLGGGSACERKKELGDPRREQHDKQKKIDESGDKKWRQGEDIERKE